MTDRERFLNSLKANGLEVREIGYTLQWTNPSWTCVAYFDAEGHFIKQERV